MFTVLFKLTVGMQKHAIEVLYHLDEVYVLPSN